MEPQFEVLWPLGRKAVNARNVAPRLPDLNGKVVAELWDNIFRGDVMYPMIREQLRASYPGVKFIEYPEFGNFHGARSRQVMEELTAKLRASGADAVISGIGA